MTVPMERQQHVTAVARRTLGWGENDKVSRGAHLEGETVLIFLRFFLGFRGLCQ